MGSEIIALAAAAAFLGYAILSTRQPVLMAAVAAYAAVVNWIIHSDMGLLMIALGMAIVLGVGGLGMVVYRALAPQDDTARYTSRKLRQNNRRLADNIGS